MDGREARKREIDRLCDEAGCSDKIRKIHFEQYVPKGAWHPHPPDSFDQWWRRHPEFDKGDGPKLKVAWNCQCYRNEWMEAKSVGLADYGNRTYPKEPNRMEETSADAVTQIP